MELINGYEVFQYCLGPEPGEAITFAELRNSLGDGYSSKVLIGSATGTRAWKLNYPYLPGGSSQASITVDGVTMTPEAYIWDLFCRHKRTGLPFVIRSAHNDQYYLAEFMQPMLDYTRFKTKLYSSSLELQQARVDGVTVFDIGQMSGLWGWYDAASLNFGTSTAEDKSGRGNNLTIHGDIIALDGTIVMNSALGAEPEPGANGGYLDKGSPMTFREALIVMEVRAPAWENHGGIISSDEDVAVLVGNDETTKFFDLELGSTFTYRKNGVAFDEDDQQSPMEEVGLVHVRSSVGITIASLQIGKDRDFLGRYARVDFKEIAIFDAGVSDSDMLEASDSLMTSWDLH